MTHDHLTARYEPLCPDCEASLVTQASLLERLSDAVEDDRYRRIGWLVLLLAVVVLAGRSLGI